MSIQAGGPVRTQATQYSPSQRVTLFDANSESDISCEIIVDYQPVIIQAHNLAVGDRVLFELIGGGDNGVGPFYTPFFRNSSQVRLTERCNITILSIPGRYRCILDGPLGVPYVFHYNASATHDFLTEMFQTMSGCCECPSLPSTLPPSGAAGGVLSGTYPNPDLNPTVAVDQIVANPNAVLMLAQALCADLQSCIDARIPTTLPPSGPASGSLLGNYPDPTLNAIQAAADITADGQAVLLLANALCPEMQPCIDARVAAGVPTSLPPNGPAGGDLDGTYPDPTVRQSAIVNAILVPAAPAIDPIPGVELTTEVIGDRSALLGKPPAWVYIKDAGNNLLGRCALFALP